MTDPSYPPPSQPPTQPTAGGDQSAYQPPPPHTAAYPTTPPPYAVGLQPTAPGKVRSTGIGVLLFIVTIGIYYWYWTYQVQQDMKRRDSRALDPVLALLLAIFLPVVMIFMTPKNIGDIYAAEGRQQPVSGWTGWWHLIPFLGGLIWFIKTNGAINRYWESYGGV